MSSSPPLVVADRYRLVAPLGQGGMGRVWRATDVVLHRDVAIKELVPPPGLTPAERQEMRERSLREARAIARLNNVNVVRVFDVLRTDADPWIVMEYVASRSLQDTLAKDGPFNPVRAAEIGLGVLNALRAAHRAGVVHRDVKPGNVLMGADGRVVLTDFGLATVPGDPNVTRTGLVLGSPAYIAPERARDGTAGPAADLWSLGATLFAAVEGQSPFARPSAIATLAALATENVPPSRAAGPLKPVLNGLLRKDPAHRINAEEAERLLARAAGRRSRMTFPMSPTMRRPGVGRERPSLPTGPGGPPVLPGSGFVTAAGSASVVPTPRPPVTAGPPQPGRPPVTAGPPQPGRPPVTAGPPQSGRPPIYAPGKAQVGGQTPPEPPARGARPPKPLAETRLDTPPIKDTPSGTREAPPAAPQSPRPGSVHGTAQPFGARPASVPPSPTRVGFTAADVAANRRKTAAPEHERTLAAATGSFPVVPNPPDAAQETTVVPPGGLPGGSRPSPGKPAAAGQATPAAPAAGPTASGQAPSAAGQATPASGQAASAAGQVAPVAGRAAPAATASGSAAPASGSAATASGSAATASGSAATASGSAAPASGSAATASASAPSGFVAPAPAASAPAASAPAASAPAASASAASAPAAPASAAPGLAAPVVSAPVVPASAAPGSAESAGQAAAAPAGSVGAQSGPAAASAASSAVSARPAADPSAGSADGDAATSGDSPGNPVSSAESGETSVPEGSAAPSSSGGRTATAGGAPSSGATAPAGVDRSEAEGEQAPAESPGSGSSAGAGSAAGATPATGAGTGSDSSAAPAVGNPSAADQSSAAGPSPATGSGSEAGSSAATGSASGAGAGSGPGAGPGSGAGSSSEADSDTGDEPTLRAAPAVIAEISTPDVPAGQSGPNGQSASAGQPDAAGQGGATAAASTLESSTSKTPQPGAASRDSAPERPEKSDKPATDSSIGGTVAVPAAEPSTDETTTADKTAAADRTAAADGTTSPDATTAADRTAAADGAKTVDRTTAGDTTPAGARTETARDTPSAAGKATGADPATPAGKTTVGTPGAPADRTAVVDKAVPARPAAPADKTTVVDKIGPAERTAIVEKSALSRTAAPADKTTVVDKAAPADRTAIVDKAALADRTAIVDPRSADRTTVVDPVAAPADRTAVVDRAAVVPPSLTPPVPANSRPPRRGRLPEPETRVVGDLNQVPGFARPSRPAWTPMPVRPTNRRTGITVLGTTLTRRQAAIGLGIVLTFVLLLGIIVVQAFGGDGKPTGAPAAAGVASGEPGPGRSAAPAKGGAKSPAAEPSSASPTSGGGVPEGWRSYEGSGWSAPVPEEASGGGGDQTELRWNNRLLIVNRINGPLGDPVANAEQQSTSHYRNYRRVGITPVDYHGAAADWEFYYTTKSGNEQHTVKRLFEIDGQTFSIAWYTTPDDWDDARADLEKIYQGFAKR